MFRHVTFHLQEATTTCTIDSWHVLAAEKLSFSPLSLQLCHDTGQWHCEGLQRRLSAHFHNSLTFSQPQQLKSL